MMIFGGGSMVRLLLDGKSNLMALGATSVDVSIKNMSKRKTRSDMEAMLKSILSLFLVCMAIIKYSVVPLKYQMN